jgi:hypothetical protein
MSFIGVIVALAVIGALLALLAWVLFYHYHNRRLGLTNQPFLPPLPGFFKRKPKSSAPGNRGVDLESGSRAYEGLGGDGDDAWDAREEYEGARLHTGPSARGFDGQDERRYDDEDLDNPFGEGATRASTKNENPFGSGARRVEDEADIGRKSPAPPVSGSRRSLFNEDI